MGGVTVCLVASLLGVDYGWRPAEGGGLEYIIQIEPDMVKDFSLGYDVFSDVPPEVRGQIRSYRITVGNERPPRIDLPQPEPSPPPQGDTPEPPEAASHPPVPEPAVAESPPSLPPRTFDPDPQSQAIGERTVGYTASSPSDHPVPKLEPETSADLDSSGSGSPPDRPWGTLIVVVFGLFGSLAANVYLGWIIRDASRRYRSLAVQLGQAASNE
ncbi:MAG: hypothetical protein HQ581_28890 [Planctomycetes bacterium]|nr:hypothetical protein [Planctomycetota bacterium]